MTTTSFVDWISYTCERPALALKDDFVRMFAVLNLGIGGIHRVKPRNAYRLAYQNDKGVLLLSTPGRDDMGVNVLLTGSTLGFFDWPEVIRSLYSVAGHFCRLDLTLDVRDSKLSIDELFKQFRDGNAICKAKKVSRVESETGQTCYVGSRTSERFLRIYDKAGEQGLEGVDWKRIELQASGDKANNMALLLMSRGPDAIASLIRDFIDFPCSKTWVSIFGQVTPCKAVSNKRVSDTQKWLMETVCKALAEQIVFDPSFEYEFQEALQACISRLKKSDKGL